MMLMGMLNTRNRQMVAPFATAELAVKHNQMTSRHRSNICAPGTPTRKSSLTSARVSTSNERVYDPYWNECCEAINSELWSPIGIDSPASAERLSTSWLNKTVEKSWFSTKLFTAQRKSLLPISSLFSTSFHAECMDSVDTVTKSKKIRILPTAEQASKMNKWDGITRYCYNMAVETLKRDGSVYAPDLLHSLPEWTHECPRHIRVYAVMDAQKAFRQYKRKVSFRSKKGKSASMGVISGAVKHHGVYVGLLGKMKYTEPLPAEVQGGGKVSERNTDIEIKDSRLKREGNKWYLIVPYLAKKKSREPSDRIVAIDPGVRTFATFYSEDSYGWLGADDIGRIIRLCHHADNLYARATKVQRPLRRKLRHAARKITKKIQNLVTELHHKVAHFLVTNFDVILLPTFQTSNMVKRASRKIRKKSVRMMLTLSHYKFKVFLKQKAKEYRKQVIDVCEAYTSKTVSWNGEINHRLGGSKVIADLDGNACERDLNGARGIFVKNVARALLVQPPELSGA